MLLQAQSPLEGDYLFLGLGAAKPIQIDQFHSPLHYHGYAASAQLGWHSYKGKWMSNLDIGGSAGLSNPYEFGTTLNSSIDLGARLHYSLRYRFWQEGKHHLLAGLYSQNFFNYRDLQNFRNSSESFAGFFGIGPSLCYIYTRNDKIFGADFNWSWQSEFNIPASTIYIRPGYTRQLITGDIAHSEHSFLGDAWQMDLRHSFIWHKRNGNQIRLCYTWEYLKSSLPTAYHYANHILSLQFFYQL